jgi:hypothetical protein
VVAVIVAIFSVRAARGSERNSKKSAEAATESAATAKESLRRQGEQEHDRLAPMRPGVLTVKRKAGSGRYGTWVVTVSFNRDYRVEAIRRGHLLGMAEAPTSRANLGPVVHGGREYEFEIEPALPDVEGLNTAEVEFRVWPPIDGDPVSVWSCPCERPSDPAGPPHWAFTEPVERKRIRADRTITS